MILPSLQHDFDHARIDDAIVGPRREVTLAITPLVWDGPNGRDSDTVRVRFGCIENFADVAAFFAAAPHKQSELAWLRYAADRQTKLGCLFFELVFERIEARMVVQCSSLQVGGVKL